MALSSVRELDYMSHFRNNELYKQMLSPYISFLLLIDIFFSRRTSVEKVFAILGAFTRGAPT